MFENAIEALFRRDFKLAEGVIEKLSEVHRLEKEAVLLTQHIKNDEIVNLRLLIESVRRTGVCEATYLEVVLNLNVESVLG